MYSEHNGYFAWALGQKELDCTANLSHIRLGNKATGTGRKRGLIGHPSSRNYHKHASFPWHAASHIQAKKPPLTLHPPPIHMYSTCRDIFHFLRSWVNWPQSSKMQICHLGNMNFKTRPSLSVVLIFSH